LIEPEPDTGVASEDAALFDYGLKKVQEAFDFTLILFEKLIIMCFNILV
jgi:hypothetical protein